LEHLFATVPDAAVRRKLLSTLRVENSATYRADGADLAPRLFGALCLQCWDVVDPEA
jgi:hypothetical protein